MNYYQRLGGYLSAENCADTNCSHHSNGVRGESGSPNSQIAALLRSMLRNDVELSPRFLAELIGISAPIDTLVSLLATGICRSRPEELSAILHDEMVCHATDERKAAAMLDLASDQDIAPLTLDELVKFFPGDISNQLKRALFRYLATVTLAGADSLLIEYAATLDDIGDSLYWTVAAANQGLCEDVIARALPEAMGDVRHLVPKPFPDSVSGLDRKSTRL